MRTILLATDGSECSEWALGFAIELARETGASLQILSVRPLRLPTPTGPEHIAVAAAERARAEGVDAFPHTTQGDIVTEIAAAAVALGADVLVVGSRGLGAVSGATLGSVSQALVRRSPIPVTVVRQAPLGAARAARA